MANYTTEQIRNVALIGHSSSGKTTLSEALLFDTGATSRRGRVEDGTTVSDWDEEAIRRKISVATPSSLANGRAASSTCWMRPGS